jgi:hypothetical protein
MLAEALRHGRGHIGHDELKSSLSLLESAEVILRDGAEIATKESLKKEREIMGSINRGIGRFDRLGGAGEWALAIFWEAKETGLMTGYASKGMDYSRTMRFNFV